MSDLLTTLHPINDNNTDLYPNVKNENIPPVISGKDAMEALDGDFSTLHTDEIQVGGENGTLINSTQIATPNKVINLDEIVDDAELAQGLNGKVDKVSGKGLSTNDYTNEDKALVATIPDKVDKVQGKGLSTNDFTDEYKKDLDQDIPDQIQLFKDAFEDVGTALNGKVDKVSGKGLSTNDYTNEDEALVATIPDKVDKVQGKGLSTNDYTNADKSYLDNLPNYFISLAKGGVANVADADMPASSNTPYFGAKNGTNSNLLLRSTQLTAKVMDSQQHATSLLMTGNPNNIFSITHLTPASGSIGSQVRQFKIPTDMAAGTYNFVVTKADEFRTVVRGNNGTVCVMYQDPEVFGLSFDDNDGAYMSARLVHNADQDSDLQDDYNIPLFLDLGVEIANNPNVESATVKATAINSGDSYFSYMILDFRIVLTSNNVNSLNLDLTFNKDIFKYYTGINDVEIHTRRGWVYCDATSDNEMTLEWTRENDSMGIVISGTVIINVGER